MKFDKSKLDALAKLPDEELWMQIKMIAERHGLKLPDKTPDKNELAKIRAALSCGDKLNLADAMRIVNKYKRGGS